MALYDLKSNDWSSPETSAYSLLTPWRVRKRTGISLDCVLRGLDTFCYKSTESMEEMSSFEYPMGFIILFCS